MILLFSKSLLRHPLARSRVSDLTGLTAFQSVLDDPKHAASTEVKPRIKKIILCSGQVFAALHEHRQKHDIQDAAIVRVEELHPFPKKRVQEVLERYPAAEDIVWAQEEPYNSGAWYYLKDKIEHILGSHAWLSGRKVRYAGRASAAAVATGSKKLHAQEEAALVAAVFKTVVNS